MPPGTALPARLAPTAAPGSDGRVELATTTPAATLGALSTWALEAGLDLADLEVRRPSLEEVYLALTADGPR